jgi:methyl-accepting chemotaxis protein
METSMKRFNDLRLAYRLGAAFGGLALALAVTAAVSLSGLGKLDASSKRMSDRDVQALQHLVVISEDFLSMGYLAVRHLYVEDGDLRAQDETAKEIAQWEQEGQDALAALRPRIEGAEAKATLASFEKSFAAFIAVTDATVELSRQETVDAVEERDGSRTAYTAEIVPVLEGLDVVHDELEGVITAQAAAQADDAAATASAVKRTVLLIVLAALMAAIGLAIAVTRSVTRPVSVLVERLRSLDERCLTSLRAGLAGLAKGDLTVEAQPGTEPIAGCGKDEVGTASATLNELIEKTHESLAAYNASRAQLGVLVGKLSGSAQTLSVASQQMASTSDETGRAVGEIATAVSDVAHGAERQVRAVEQVRVATEEVASASEVGARTATATAQAALSTRDVAEQGAGAVAQASQAMGAVRDSSLRATEAIRELGAKSGQIEGIVQTITGIAEQTNLLALNAAIEAARAGEQGRGFAVVAEEVRKLAEESQSAAASIGTLVSEIQGETTKAVEVVEDGARRTEDGVATVELARESFLQVSERVQDMNGRVEEIAAAIEQIATASQQVRHDIGEVAAVAEQSSASAEQVSASTQQTSASAQEIAAAAQELAGTAEQLEQLVGEFTLARA